MPPVTISDIITVGDIAILDENRWPTECDLNGTIIAIISKVDKDDYTEQTRWFNADKYQQYFSVKTTKIEEYLLVILPHSQKYQLEGYKSVFFYSETTFLNRRCIVTLPDLVKQISPTCLYSKDKIAVLITRETLMLPTKVNRE